MFYVECFRQDNGKVIAELPMGNYLLNGTIHKVDQQGLCHNVFVLNESQLSEIKYYVDRKITQFYTNDDLEKKNPLTHEQMAERFQEYRNKTGDLTTSCQDIFFSEQVQRPNIEDVEFIVNGDYPVANKYFCPSRELNNDYKNTFFHYDYEAHICDVIADTLMEYGYQEVKTMYSTELKDYEFDFKFMTNFTKAKVRTIHNSLVKIPNSTPQSFMTVFKDVLPSISSNSWTGRQYKTMSLTDAQALFDELRVKIREAVIVFVNGNAPISELNPVNIRTILTHIDSLTQQINKIDSKIKTSGNLRSAKESVRQLKELIKKSVSDSE